MPETRNIRAMRLFYTMFQIRHALRAELSRMHCRSIIRGEKNVYAVSKHLVETYKKNDLCLISKK